MTFQKALIEATKETFLFLWGKVLAGFRQAAMPATIIAALFAPAVPSVIFYALINIMNWIPPKPITIIVLIVMYFLGIIFIVAINKYRLSKKQGSTTMEVNK